MSIDGAPDNAVQDKLSQGSTIAREMAGDPDGMRIAKARSMSIQTTAHPIHQRHTRTTRRGMTLVEVMLVVAIIAMVAAAASVSGFKIFGSSQSKTAQNDARVIRGAVKTWWLTDDASVCPTIEQLVKDGILDKDGHRSDPWGTPFRIACANQDVTVRSAGVDRKFETEDDIVIPKS